MSTIFIRKFIIYSQNDNCVTIFIKMLYLKMKKWWYLVILTILYVNVSNSAKILASIFIPSYSHQLPFRPLWKELAKRGHEITYITTNPMRDPSIKNIKEIDLSESYKILQVLNTTCGVARETTGINEFVNDIIQHFDAIDTVIDWQLSQPEIKGLIDNGTGYFDIFIVEVMNPIYIAFAEK